ncbi:MAG: acetolactate decarboxylase [Flavobacteriales bacterium]|nr:acetolactate decarboxylase [Flavobacteriales bacterium]
MTCSLEGRGWTKRATLLVWAVVPLLLGAQVIATGAMRDVIHNGQGAGVISMDSLTGPGLYGVGPLEHLRGEITVIDGVCHVARVVNHSVRVSVNRDVRAPFFVHTRVDRWEPVALPDSVLDLAALDAFLTARAGMDPGPFAFRLVGDVDSASAHVLAVPENVEVRSREEAHAYDAHVSFTKEPVELIGFFSTAHRTVFTHHDSNIHMHVISPDRKRMGHADMAMWRAGGMRLLVGR